MFFILYAVCIISIAFSLLSELAAQKRICSFDHSNVIKASNEDH